MEVIERIRPSEKQWLILNKAIELLKPYNKEESTDFMCYFTDKNDEEIGSEFDCCEDCDCVIEAKKMIRKEYGNRKIIQKNYTDTYSDYDYFERCCICGKYFTKGLTWIEDEFEHHEKNSVTEEDIKHSSTAYELINIYESLYWNCDNRVSEYQKNQYRKGNKEPFESELKRQKDLIEKVVKHAQLVINQLEGIL